MQERQGVRCYMNTSHGCGILNTTPVVRYSKNTNSGYDIKDIIPMANM